jgi:hypothetical protein
MNNVTYDASGNTLSDGTNTYTWNAAGQLASVQNSKGRYSFTYDGLGRRVIAFGNTYHYNGQSSQIGHSFIFDMDWVDVEKENQS